MRPVQGGTQKLTMNSTENDYQQKLRQAQAQADGNPYVAGIQEVFNAGAGEASKESRTQYGNVNLMPQEVLEGSFSNYQQNDAPANSPMNDPMNQSASMETGTSMTTGNPAEGPEEMATDKLTERLNMYAQAGSNAGFGHNNRQETMRLG
tara:strand:+ start:2047 stop:2496 length:450 start_codon:yes stop_codon:yes gene_type:complete